MTCKWAERPPLQIVSHKEDAISKECQLRNSCVKDFMWPCGYVTEGFSFTTEHLSSSPCIYTYIHIHTRTHIDRWIDINTCAHTRKHVYLYIYICIYIYIYIFFSSSWSGYNYFSLQGILRALPGSSNKVHHIVERSKGNIIEGEEQNSFLSCIISCNRSTPLKTIIVVSESRYFLPMFQEGKCSSCSVAVYRGATMWFSLFGG